MRQAEAGLSPGAPLDLSAWHPSLRHPPASPTLKIVIPGHGCCGKEAPGF